jgi:hypothetical protein
MPFCSDFTHIWSSTVWDIVIDMPDASVYWAAGLFVAQELVMPFDKCRISLRRPTETQSRSRAHMTKCMSLSSSIRKTNHVYGFYYMSFRCGVELCLGPIGPEGVDPMLGVGHCTCHRKTKAFTRQYDDINSTNGPNFGRRKVLQRVLKLKGSNGMSHYILFLFRYGSSS